MLRFPLVTLLSCKEMCAISISSHKKGFRDKFVAASKVAPKSTICQIIKNFKERGSVVVRWASGCP